jgi:hypothetical protein
VMNAPGFVVSGNSSVIVEISLTLESFCWDRNELDEFMMRYGSSPYLISSSETMDRSEYN